MDWLSLALAFLKLANLVMGQVRSAEDRKAGRDEEIARQAIAILGMTNAGKKYLEDFTSKPGSADEFLRSLEPKS